MLEDFLATARSSAETGVIVDVLGALALAHFRRADFVRGLARAEEAHDLALQAQGGTIDRLTAARLAIGRFSVGDFEGAIALARAAYDIALPGAVRTGCAMTLFDMLHRAGRADEAEAILPDLDPSLPQYRPYLRALLAVTRRDAAAAQAAMAEAPSDVAAGMESVHVGCVARVAVLCGDRDAALAAVDTLLRLDEQFSDAVTRAEALEHLALAFALSGDPVDADAGRVALAEADHLRALSGTVRCPIDEADVAAARVTLGQ
jgi:thioredoxin-like negative regulator of GroEL